MGTIVKVSGPCWLRPEAHPSWLVPSGLLSTLGRDKSALPMILRGIQFLVNVDRA